MTTIHWPTGEWVRASRLLAKGLSVQEVAKEIQRSPKQLRGKLAWESMTPEQREDRAERIKHQRKSRAKVPDEARYQPEPIISTFKVPAEVLEERYKRQSIIRNPIDELLGVPPPGYSALDKREQRA